MMTSWMHHPLFFPFLFFGMGLLIGLRKTTSDPSVGLSRWKSWMTLYLIAAIGWKGGLSLSTGLQTGSGAALLLVSAVVLSALLPFLCYWILRFSTRLDAINAAAISSHYGSISLITFVAAASFLEAEKIGFEGAIIAAVALMEIPAIFTGLYLAQRSGDVVRDKPLSKWGLVQHVLTSRVILTLLGFLLAGWALGGPALQSASKLFLSPFQIVLNLFLLDMGLVVARQRQHWKGFHWKIAAFGIYMPLISGGIGLFLSWLLHLDLGTGLLFTVLAASASNIAVPAVLRMTLPQASEALYFPLALGITFPFNVVIGIPLYYKLATLLL